MGLAAAAMVFAMSAAPAQEVPRAGFCASLAPQIGMKRAGAGTPSEWEVNMLGGLKAALLGGTAGVSMVARPIDRRDAAEAERLYGACKLVSGGAACAFVGPASFEITTGAKSATVAAAPGERAEVWMAKTKIRCRSAAAAG